MIKKAILSVLFFVVASCIAAQSSDVRDSLLNRLHSMPADQMDSDRVKALNALGYEYYLYRPDTAYLLGQQAYEIAQKISFAPGEARALVTMGLGLSLLGDYAKAIKVYGRARQLYHEQGNINGELTALNNIAASYGEQEKWSDALETMEEVYQVYQSLGKGDPGVKPIYLLNLGEAFYNVKKYDSAVIYLEEGLPLAKDNPEVHGNILYDMGDVALARNEFDKARYYYQLCINEFLLTDSYQTWYEGYYRLAKFSRQTANRDSAIYFAHLALDASEKAAYPRGILKSSQLLSALYEGKNDAEALHYYKMSVAAKDSIYSQEKIKQMLSLSFEEKEKQMQIAAAKAEYRNQVRVYVLAGIALVIAAIAGLLLRNNNQRKKAYELLQKQKQETDIQKEKVESTLSELRSAQEQLIHSAKMASLGELTAGIAHEIQNPLNFVNNFSDVNKELLMEMKDEMDKGNVDDAKEIAKNVINNSEKIHHHGKRADSIVKGMLQHSRTSSGIKEPTDINALADEYLRLSYHGMRAKDKSFNAEIKTDFDESIAKINIARQDIGRVLLNLFNNAFYALNEKRRLSANSYEPIAEVRTRRINDKVEIVVKDNGNGIPQNLVDKIFQPFFTTKPTGQGTGLGLSLAYDIIKAHGGEITVQTKAGEGSQFVIVLPLTWKVEEA